MHDTAMEYGGLFFRTYLSGTSGLKIVDIGAQDVNGSLRSHNLPTNQYIGVDFVEGKGVDVILTDPYELPFDSDSIDAIVCSSCFEHSEFFWELFLECIRILKPAGLFYINVPSNGVFHRYPVDCWRFYPDSGRALARWGQRNGYNTALLESFTGVQKSDIWNDFIAVFVKDEQHAAHYPKRMLNALSRYTNGFVLGTEEPCKYEVYPEDQRKNPIRRHWKTGIRAARLVGGRVRRRLRS